jgi:hypothetical protein
VPRAQHRALPGLVLRIEQASRGRQDLGEVLGALVEQAARSLAEALVNDAHHADELLAARLQVVVDRVVKARFEPQVQEEPRAGEDDRHHQREHERDAKLDRDPDHPAPSSRSR